jgi:hypothetical protein
VNHSELQTKCILKHLFQELVQAGSKIHANKNQLDMGKTKDNHYNILMHKQPKSTELYDIEL